MKSWDVIIIGGGLIGLSIALRAQRNGATVLLVERGEPGHEASYAAAGMLAHCDPHTPSLLRPLAEMSAKLYPEFVRELEEESGEHVDLRCEGTIFLSDAATPLDCPHGRTLSAQEVTDLEPGLRVGDYSAAFLPESCVDPRTLVAAALKAAKRRGIEVASGTPVLGVELHGSKVSGVRTARTRFMAGVVVNCAGAWSGEISPLRFATKPVKGQMLAKIVPIAYDDRGSPSSPRILRHVVRAPGVYLVPRGDGRIVIGSTLEDAGFDKRVNPDTIQDLHHRALALLPALAEARMHESWAGLRPGTPDGLPILGPTSMENYFVASGHYRDGILLAPATAHVMSRLIQGLSPETDLSAFMPARFL